MSTRLAKRASAARPLKAAWKTRYVRDALEMEAIDGARLLRELGEASPGSDPADFIDQTALTLAAYDHVALATEQSTGRCLGLLGALDGVTARGERFLFLRTGFVGETARGQGLMGRMLALTLLRAAGDDVVPAIIAVRTSSPLFCRILYGFGAPIAGSKCHPDPAGVVDLATAGLCRRIAAEIAPEARLELGAGVLRGGVLAAGGRPRPRTLSRDPLIDALFALPVTPADQIVGVLDLRAAEEAAVIERARRVYRRS